MIQVINLLFGWLPTEIAIIVLFILGIFLVWTLVEIVIAIMDILPFA